MSKSFCFLSPLSIAISNGSLLESILRSCFRVVQLKDCSVFGKQSLLLLLDNIGLSDLLLSLSFLFCLFGLSLLLVDDKLILPQLLHLSLVFLLAHPSSLGVHLLETLILGELLHQLSLEFVLHSLFFGFSFLLKFHLELLGSLEFGSDADTLFSLSSLLCLG